ncbi:hypothetical protein [Alloactinosynnema sp. L-07]|uniref:hypothetical protein n=1 Tax=Alloactinosynnema sp. L-07 TaxID=1653480 RepID=UPI0012FC639F|nr:hypothetical protein [Alloactinosynnema sp. L-07]
MGKREMDDEQRERMHDLKRLTWRGVLAGGVFLVFAIVAGVFLLDDWTAFLFWGSLNLVLTMVVFVSQWRYIRRGPFPRLPVSVRDGTTPRPTRPAIGKLMRIGQQVRMAELRRRAKRGDESGSCQRGCR